MSESAVAVLVALVLVVARGARADVGALSVEAGGGVAIVRTPSPYSAGAQSGSAPSIWLGARYGISNQLELTLSAFYELAEPYYLAGTTVITDSGRTTGTLSTRAKRFGALVGARMVRGNVWRVVVGGEVGWAQQSYSSSALFDDASPPRDYGLGLSDTSKPFFALAPSAGVVWVGDKLSISLVPRLELLVGATTTWAASVPLTIGWDFYLF